MTRIDAWVEAAPAHWTRARIKNLLAAATNGTWGSDPTGDGNDVHCVRAADFDRTRGRARVEDSPLRSLDAESFRKNRLRVGDLILEKSGGGEKQPVGMAVLYEGGGDAVCSNFCARVTPGSHVDPRFLAYVFAAAYAQGLTQNAVKQTTGIQNLDSGTFFSSPWCFPENDEQCQIADFLDAALGRIDALAEATRAQQVLVERREGVAFHESVREEQGPSLDELDARVTGPGWQMLALNRTLSQLTNGYVGPTRDLFVDTGVEYLQSLHIKKGQIDFDRRPYFVRPEWAAERPRIRLARGDLLIVQTGAIGEVAIVDDDFAGASCHALLIARCSRDILLPEYLWHLFRSYWGRNLLLREQTGALHPHLEAGNVRFLRIPIPSVQRQRRIIARTEARVKDSRALFNSLSRRLSLQAERRQALITAAVTGQFDVSSASGRGLM